MIVACPSCATRYHLPAGHGGADGSVIRCSICGHSWIEARAVEVVEAKFKPLAGPYDDPEVDDEARRIAEASRSAAARREAARRQRQKEGRGWAVLGLSVLIPFAVGVAFPETVVRTAPAAARLYAFAGIDVNIHGFVIRNAASEVLMVSGTAVLAVRGDIANITSQPQPVPSLRFVLRDETGAEAYAWTLTGSASRRLMPGEATAFVTRVAAPPEAAREVEIRFARDDEIGVKAEP